MKALDIRLQALADGEISAFEGFLLFEKWDEEDFPTEELLEKWMECWQEDAICIFRPHNDADESDNLIGFWDAGKILEKHCQLNSDLNAAYFLIDVNSFIAICDMKIIRDFAKENSIAPIFSIIG